jgi:hypothetical protein
MTGGEISLDNPALGAVKDMSREASAYASGDFNFSTGEYSTAEGTLNVASGLGSRAGGVLTVASGDMAITEGYKTSANAKASRAQGHHTVAASAFQEAAGEYNLVDEGGSVLDRGWWVKVWGNGSEAAASNAAALNWNGALISSANAAPVDAEMWNSSWSLFDDAGTLKVKRKAGDGNVTVGAVSAVTEGAMIFKGAIATAADFPTAAEVKNGWMYRITADVTDNDPAKTNTGEEFKAEDEIAWNGSSWTKLGSASVETESAPVVLGTSGAVTIDRSAGDKFTLTPSGAVTLSLANFTHLQEAILTIIDGDTNVSFPADWKWQTAVPSLQLNGIDYLKIVTIIDSEDTRVFVWYSGTLEGLTGNDANTLFLLNCDTDTDAFYDEAVGVATPAVVAPVNGIVASTTELLFDKHTLFVNSTVAEANQRIQITPDEPWDISGDWSLDFQQWISAGPPSYLEFTPYVSLGLPGYYFAYGPATYLGASAAIRLDSNKVWLNCENNKPNFADGWHHVLLMYKRSTQTLSVYFDGVFSNSNTFDCSTTMTSLVVGPNWDNSSGVWQGYFAQVRLSNILRWTSNFTSPAKPYGN